MIVYEFYGRIGVYDLYAPVFFGFDIDVSVFYDDVYVQIVIRPSVEVDADVAVPERLLLFKIPEIKLIVKPVVQIIISLVLIIRLYFSVFEFYDSGGIEPGQLHFVCNQHYQAVSGNSLDDIHYFYGIGAVQISCRFVGDDYLGILSYGSGYAYPLSFSSREHIGHPVPVAVYSQCLKNVFYPFPDLFLISDAYHSQNHSHVFIYCHVVYQLIVLKYISYIEISYLVYF